eukprot:g34598.t1
MLGHFEIKEEVVLDLLNSIKVDKSPSPDGIYSTLLREAREEIHGALTKVFVSSLTTGQVLKDWRVANVVPLFKKANRDNQGNCRLVSLTLMVGKLLERILTDRIYAYSEMRGLIRDSQHGFVQDRSCLTNLIEFFKEVTKVINEGRVVDVVYIDFSKAFDKVPHGRLIQKMKMHRIHGDLAACIQNWLAHRRQRVVVKAHIPKTSKIFSFDVKAFHLVLSS